MTSCIRPPKISYPPYLPNGEQLWWDFYTIGFRTLENGGVGHLKTPKKKPNFGGNTHVTLNPKPGSRLSFLPTNSLRDNHQMFCLGGQFVAFLSKVDADR